MSWLASVFGINGPSAADRLRDMYTQTSPMQQVLDGLKASGGFTLSDYVQAASEQGYTGEEIANLSGADVRGMVIDEAGIKQLREVWPAASEMDQPLNLTGANITGCVFKPASTVNHVMFDQVSVEDAKMQHLHFDGFSQEGACVAVDHCDMSFFSVSGEADRARFMQFDFSGTVAQGGNVANSAYTSISAHPSDDGVPANLSGLNATSARALHIDAQGVDLNGAHFTGATFGPDTSMVNCNLIGADFSGATMHDVDLSGSRLWGADLSGVELSKLTLDGAEIRPVDLHGALYHGQVVGTDIDPAEVMSAVGMHEPNKNIDHILLRVEQQTARLDNKAHSEAASETQQDLSGTDQLLTAMMQAQQAMGQCGIQRTESDVAHDADLLVTGAINSAQLNETNCHRVDHSEEWARGPVQV